MEKAKIIFSIIMILFLGSCQMKNETDNEDDQLLSDEQISSNLAKSGKIDPELLIGEWDAIKFAYTSDGEKILDLVSISSNSTVKMDNTTNLNEELLGPLLFMYCGYFYSRSNNLINYLDEKTACFAIYISHTNVEIKIINALKNTYCYVIKDKELIIYFKGIENENLLIFKKR